jgi:hypothetical protein
MRPSGARRVALQALVCLFLALFASAPLTLAPLTRLVGHPDVDVTNHAWGPWWWWWTLGRGDLPWSTTLLATPTGGVLWFIDPFTALVGAPFVGIIGAIGAYNLAIVVSLAIVAAGGRALARAIGATDGAAWLAAAACVVSPYVLSEVHNGVSEAVNVGWASLTLAAARRAIDANETGVLRRWLPVGAWLGVTAMGTWYYALAAGVTIAAWVALEGAGGRRTPIERLRALPLGGGAFAAFIALLLAAPVLSLVRLSISDPRSLVVRGDVDPAVRVFLQAHNAVDPRAFVAPLGFQSVDLAAQGEAFLHSSYLGLVALALAGFALRSGGLPLRRVAAGVLPATVLSLGAYLWWGGAWVELGGGRIALPFAWLTWLLPDAGSTHAQRLVWPALAVVSALAARGVATLAPAPRYAFSGLVVIDLLLASPWPLARVDALDTTAHANLAKQAKVERAAAIAAGSALPAIGVLDLPAEAGNTMATSVYLLYQTVSGLPIPYRPDARGGTSSAYGLQAFNVLYAPSATRPEQAEALRTELAGQTGIDIGSLQTKGGIRWIVLHRELERGRGDVAILQAQLEDWFGVGEEAGPHLTFDVRHRRNDGGRVLAPGGG